MRRVEGRRRWDSILCLLRSAQCPIPQQLRAGERGALNSIISRLAGRIGLNNKPSAMKFSRPNKNQFFTDLKLQVGNYFIQKKIDKYAKPFIVLKGTLLCLLYLSAYSCIYFSTNPVVLAPVYIVLGLSAVMIVFNLVHDASHGAISRIRWINKSICFIGDLVGINTYIWNIRHNVQHHSFTNVLGGDLIIDNIPIIRISPHQPYRPVHRFQVFYTPFFYALYSFYWMFVIDLRLFMKKDICNLHHLKHPLKEWIILILTKAFYITYMIVLPAMFTPLSLLSVIGYFFIMHFAAGMLLSIVAVLGHFVEGPSFPEATNGLIDNSWSEHELEATIDFAPKSKIVNWMTGGLNTHVADHLFPDVCHAHYYQITGIIEAYCRANNYPYKKETLAGALRSHYRFMKALSKP